MTLRLIREPSLSSTTLGVLFADDRFYCFSLEDELRERAGVPVQQWKVPGQTAIPAGRYRVALTHSPKFGRVLPEVLEVPGFAGIRIHSGNRHVDTEGCILLGLRRAGVVIEQSRTAVEKLQEQIAASAARGDSVFVAIENPMSYSG